MLWMGEGWGSLPQPATTDYPYEHFCIDRECACSGRTTDNVPCWACGGETSKFRPAWWPYSGANQTVRGGNSFSVRELDAPEEESAA